MDERQYGGLPQQRTYDRSGQLKWPDEYNPPNRAGLYNQANHSSPSLNANAPGHPYYAGSKLSTNQYADEPAAVDDINLRLENMRFDQQQQQHPPQSRMGQQQRDSIGSSSSIYHDSPQYRKASPLDSVQAGGADRAIEIRNDNGQTASVYSLEYQQRYGASAHINDRRRSDGSVYYDDQNYREIPQAMPPGDALSQGQPRLVPQPSWYSQGGGGDPYATSPPFNQQQPHSAWSYESTAAAAAANPYYAAATGQLGFPGAATDFTSPSPPSVNSLSPPGSYGPGYGLSRATSSASHLSGGPSQMMLGGSIGRSPSMLSVPQPPAPPLPGQPMSGNSMIRRQPTTSSSGRSSSAYSGPPITKQSVDEYRNRIKADPDPEAQFNFAKYLIEAAKKISSSASGDEKSAKKYRDALLAESLKLIKRLATQGSGLGKPAYADAQFFLANCLGNGSLGLQVDHEKAYNLYVQASKQNHPAATYRTAVCNEVGAGTRRDHARAVLFYRKASALGDTAGMYKLGMILRNGLLGQQRNPKEAIAWLKRAAAQADEDNPHALHELGMLYERGGPPVAANSGAPSQSLVGGGGGGGFVPHDPAQARELFTQAAQLGYPPSQFKLGSCYEYGSLTCPVDPRRSIAWYTRAAERGDAESELALSGWYLTGSDGVLKQSDSEAYLWARRAANKGLPKAEYAVGYYSEVGIGVKQDIEEAKRWYMRAAAQGNKRAMQRLTELKRLGQERGRAGAKTRPTRQQAEKECTIM